MLLILNFLVFTVFWTLCFWSSFYIPLSCLRFLWLLLFLDFFIWLNLLFHFDLLLILSSSISLLFVLIFLLLFLDLIENISSLWRVVIKLDWKTVSWKFNFSSIIYCNSFGFGFLFNFYLFFILNYMSLLSIVFLFLLFF